MDVSEAKRLKQLEDENAKLKKLLADQMLDAAALRELLSKKWCQRIAKRKPRRRGVKPGLGTVDDVGGRRLVSLNYKRT
jgi:hypothetical protein